jgi:hypothetical protein
MTRKIRIVVACAAALVLLAAAATVWAAKGRQGTVPIPVASGDIKNCEFLTLGTVQIKVFNPCATGTASLIPDPAGSLAPAPKELSFLADTVSVKLDKVADLQVCYPYTQEIDTKGGKVYDYDEDSKSWNVVEATVSGNPSLICIVEKGTTAGSYALMGK